MLLQSLPTAPLPPINHYALPSSHHSTLAKSALNHSCLVYATGHVLSSFHLPSTLTSRVLPHPITSVSSFSSFVALTCGNFCFVLHLPELTVVAKLTMDSGIDGCVFSEGFLSIYSANYLFNLDVSSFSPFKVKISPPEILSETILICSNVFNNSQIIVTNMALYQYDLNSIFNNITPKNLQIKNRAELIYTSNHDFFVFYYSNFLYFFKISSGEFLSALEIQLVQNISIIDNEQIVIFHDNTKISFLSTVDLFQVSTKLSLPSISDCCIFINSSLFWSIHDLKINLIGINNIGTSIVFSLNHSIGPFPKVPLKNSFMSSSCRSTSSNLSQNFENLGFIALNDSHCTCFVFCDQKLFPLPKISNIFHAEQNSFFSLPLSPSVILICRSSSENFDEVFTFNVVTNSIVAQRNFPKILDLLTSDRSEQLFYLLDQKFNLFELNYELHTVKMIQNFELADSGVVQNSCRIFKAYLTLNDCKYSVFVVPNNANQIFVHLDKSSLISFVISSPENLILSYCLHDTGAFVFFLTNSCFFLVNITNFKCFKINHGLKISNAFTKISVLSNFSQCGFFLFLIIDSFLYIFDFIQNRIFLSKPVLPCLRMDQVGFDLVLTSKSGLSTIELPRNFVEQSELYSKYLAESVTFTSRSSFWYNFTPNFWESCPNILNKDQVTPIPSVCNKPRGTDSQSTNQSTKQSDSQSKINESHHNFGHLRSVIFNKKGWTSDVVDFK
ncbi:hypothetical protein P9112_009831 [Eukaryota sp. TZLM1-RC]